MDGEFNVMCRRKPCLCWVLFFGDCRGFVDRTTQRLKGEAMDFTAAGFISVLVLAYLAYAMFNPERF